MLLMLEVSYVYSVYSDFLPLPGGKGLAFHHQSLRGGRFVNFVDLSTTIVIAANPQFLN